MIPDTQPVRRTLPTPWLMLVIIMVLVPIPMHFTRFCLTVFAMPAAWLSATLLGTRCVPVDAGYMLDNGTLPVLVSAACSGSNFYILVVAMGIGLAHRRHQLRVATILTALVIAYPITVLTNTCRITLGFHAAIWARQILPQAMWAGAHLTVGVLVFIVALIGATGITEWRLHHADVQT
jgi:exosortase K